MYIEVISTPPGSSPDWVRDAMVGIKMRTEREGPVSMPTINSSKAPKTRWGQWLYIFMGRAEMRTGYIVRSKDLLGLLALNNAEAADWCIENAPHMAQDGQMFLFDQSCCRQVYMH